MICIAADAFPTSVEIGAAIWANIFNDKRLAYCRAFHWPFLHVSPNRLLPTQILDALSAKDSGWYGFRVVVAHID